MPIFENELPLSSIPATPVPDAPLGSPDSQKITAPDLGGFREQESQYIKQDIDRFDKYTNIQDPIVLGSPVQMIPKSELLENKRYGLYERGADLEEEYALGQSAKSQLWNGIVKFGATSVGTFAQGFGTLPDTIAAIKSGSTEGLEKAIAELSNPDGYEASIDNWLKNLEDRFPNYYTRYEQAHPFRAAIPGFAGSANFWGDKFIKNLGFTVGAIGSAIAQDAIIGAVTGGVGEIPLLAAQIGKASLALNKIFAGARDVDKLLDAARFAGKTTEEVLSLQRLVGAAKLAQINNGLRYGLTLYGSARTEAAVEARDGYRQVKEALIDQYKSEHLGEEPDAIAISEIEKYAEDAMNTRFGINMALLTVSNAVQFDNLFKAMSKAGTVGITSTMTKNIQGLGKIGFKEGSIDAFEKKAAAGVMENVWERVRPVIPTMFTEGVYEEGGQYAAEKGTYDYFTRKYKDPSRRQNIENWDTLNEVIKSTHYGMAQQFGTTEGLENMFLGALTGIFADAVKSGVDRSRGKGKDERLNRAVNLLNEYGVTGILSDSYENTLDSAAIGQEMKDAADSGDVFKYKNLKHDMFFKYVMSRIPSGMHDITIDQLEMLKGLSKEEFEKSFGMDFSQSNKATVAQYVDSLIAKANSIKKATETYDKMFVNPFTYNDKAVAGSEEEKQNEYFKEFNNYKINLVYQASVIDDLNSRWESINTSLANLNPRLNNELVLSASNRDMLDELSNTYEKEANRLNETITSKTPLADKRKIKSQIDALRTMSEKINLENIDPSYLFHQVVNFELNGRDSTLADVVSPTEAEEALFYGIDLNRNVELKKHIGNATVAMTSKAGFTKFMEGLAEMQKEKPVAQVTPGVYDFLNADTQKETPVVGKQYVAPISAFASYEKLADDRYKVTTPSGRNKFYKTEERAKQAVEEINYDVAQMAGVTVLALNADGTIKVENLKGNIKNISPSELKGYTRHLTEEEKLGQFKEGIDKQQEEINKTSGGINATPPSENTEEDADDTRKPDVSVVFLASTTESELFKSFANSPAYINNARVFLNDINNMPNRATMRAILATANNEKGLGLEGLVSMAFDGKVPENVTSEDLGFIAQVYISVRDGRKYFVDKTGKEIGEVGKPLSQEDLKKVVFQTMRTTEETYTSTGKSRARKGQEAAYKAGIEVWRNTRARILATSAEDTQPYTFVVSRGLPIVNTIDGKSEVNHVGGILVPESEISKRQGLIQISDGKITHQGKNIFFSSGTPVLQFENTLQSIRTNLFNKEQASNVYAVIQAFTNDILNQGKAKKEIILNPNYVKFLQGVLFYNSIKAGTASNGIFIDTKNMQLVLGKKKYALSAIPSLEKEIIEQLQGIYHNVNKNFLEQANFNKKFIEYVRDETGAIKPVEWKNYQTYLLSSKNPDGSTRSASATPLYTHVAAASEAIPYSYEQKYSILTNLEFSLTEERKKEQEKKEEKKEEEKSEPEEKEEEGPKTAGNFKLDGSKNTVQFSQAYKKTNTVVEGEVNFTAKIENGIVKVVIADDADFDKLFEKILDNDLTIDVDTFGIYKEQVTKALPNLKGKELSDRDVLYAFLTLNYKTLIQEELKKTQQEVKPEETKVEPEAPKGAPKIDRSGGGRKIQQLIGEEENEEFKVSVATLKRLAAKLSKRTGIKHVIINDPSQRFKGTVDRKNNVATINLAYATLDTPIHEIAAHPVIHAIKKSSPALYAKLLEELKEGTGKEVLERVMTTYAKDYNEELFKQERFADQEDLQAEVDAYNNDPSNFEEEALTELLGMYGAEKLNSIKDASLIEKIRELIRSIVRFIKGLFNKKEIDVTKLSDATTLRDLANLLSVSKEKLIIPAEEEESLSYQKIGKVVSSEIPGITEPEAYQYVEDMLVMARQILLGDNNANLYTGVEVNADVLYNEIKDSYKEIGLLDELGEDRFNMLYGRLIAKLYTLNIRFSELDDLDINDPNMSQNDYARGTFDTDWKKYSPYPVKLAIATLPRTATTKFDETSIELPELATSSIGGYMLNNFSKIFATTLEKLSNTSSPDLMKDKLLELAKSDVNYMRLFTIAKGNVKEGRYMFENFTADDWRFFIQFYQTFTKQKPNITVQILSGNESQILSADQYNAAANIQKDWYTNMKVLAKASGTIITYDKNKKEYWVRTLSSKEYPVDTTEQQIKFLNDLGITFPMGDYEKLNQKDRNKFASSVHKIRTYLNKGKAIGNIKGDVLGVADRVKTLAGLFMKANNIAQSTTHINVEGSRSQSYTENNYSSVFSNDFNTSGTKEELLTIRPELNDPFSTGSEILREGGKFFDEDGNKVEGAEIVIGTIEGTLSRDTDKGTSTAKMTESDKTVQEINENLKGTYHIVSSGEGSTEWNAALGTFVEFDDIYTGDWKDVNRIFKNYLLDEVALIYDYDNRKHIRNIKDKGKQLRFFSGILDKDIVEKIETLAKENPLDSTVVVDYINDHIDKINDNIKSWVLNSTKETVDYLKASNKIRRKKVKGVDVYTYAALNNTFVSEQKVNPIDKLKLTEEAVTSIIAYANINYMIANMEFHKLFFGDPFQFKLTATKVDEIKRTKLFHSPRRTTFDSPEMNAFLDSTYNTVNGIKLTPNDPGYRERVPYRRTVTVRDVMRSSEHYDEINETDGAALVLDVAYHESKVRNAQDAQLNPWHQWQMAWTRQNLPGYEYSSKELEQHDKELLETPEPDHSTEIIKPITTGTKNGKTRIDIVVDKDAEMVLYYKNIKGKALGRIYEKMFKEHVDALIYESSRKVGVEGVHDLYDSKGNLNESPFPENAIVEVPMKIYGVQTETSFVEGKMQTLISQLTNISSIDMFDKGVPYSKEAKENFERHNRALNLLQEYGFNQFMSDLGISENVIYSNQDLDTVTFVNTIQAEMFKRSMSNNAKASISVNEDGQLPAPIEASIAYKKIKDIVYSMLHKSIVSIKLNGKPHIQAPVTLWESEKEGRGIALKEKLPDGKIKYTKISREGYEELSDDQKKNVVLTSDTLKFYEDKDGKRYCEVMIPCHIKKSFDPELFPTDQSIMDYLNNLPNNEGIEILTGVGARIPTQGMSSVEVFRVKEFLPESMGDTVIVPSEITAKAGSDFDVDKLNMYLKNVYRDSAGNVRLARYLGSEEKTKTFFSELYDKKRINNERLINILSQLEQHPDISIISPKKYLSVEDYMFYAKNLEVLYNIIDAADELGMKASEYLETVRTSEYSEKLPAKEVYVNRMYKKALENEYFEALEKLVTLPQNFDRLISPVTNAQLLREAEEMRRLKGEDKDKSPSPERFLNRRYMTHYRHNLTMGKGWIGIVAVNIIGQSAGQKANLHIDPKRFSRIPIRDRKILKDGSIVLPHNTTEDGKVAMGGVFTADGKNSYISSRLSAYITGAADIGNDDSIVQVIPSDLVIGVAMFLERIGSGEYVKLFLNQPIIMEYIKQLESNNYRFLFGATNIKQVKQLFPTISNKLKTTKIDPNQLAEHIKKYASGAKFDVNDNAIQHLILDEFLKYAKMAEYSFKLTQATNYNTTKFRDSDSFVLKETKTELANQTNIFSSAENMLNINYFGVQKDFIDKAVESTGAIFMLERPEYRAILNRVLAPYMERSFLSREDFETISYKARMSFMDYLISIRTPLGQEMKDLVIGENSVANRLRKLKETMPDSPLIRDLVIRGSERPNSAETISINLKMDDYDEDVYAGLMRDLRNTNPEFYKDLIKVIVLQGSQVSRTNIRNIIPSEDYQQMVSNVFTGLTITPDIEKYADGIFQRMNFREDAVMPYFIPEFKTSIDDGELDVEAEPIAYDKYENPIYQYVAGKNFPSTIFGKSSDRRILLIPTSNFKYAPNDYLKVKRVMTLASGDNVDFLTGRSVTPAHYNERRAAGDTTMNDIFGYEKVKDTNGEYLITPQGEYVYKLINLWGDAPYITETYTSPRKSVLDNGTFKLDEELKDEDIVDYFAQEESTRTVEEADDLDIPSFIPSEEETFIISREFTPDNIQTLGPNEIFVFGSNTEGRHGKGAALTAKQKFGAIYGQAEGYQGKSYAIITKDLSKGERSISLYSKELEKSIYTQVLLFLGFARRQPHLKFYVTKLGSSLAGYTIEEIKEVFNKANGISGIPDNVILPKEYEVRENIVMIEKTKAPEIVVSTSEKKRVSLQKEHEKITTFFNNLSSEKQKTLLENQKVNSLQELIEIFDIIPWEYPASDYIEDLNCKL